MYLANDGNKTGLAASPGLMATAIARHSASLLRVNEGGGTWKLLFKAN